MGEIDARFLERMLPGEAIFAGTFDKGDANDSSALNRTPTVSSGATFINGVIDFDGTANAAVTYPDSADFDSTELSVSFWARIDGGNLRMNLIAKSATGFTPARSRGWFVHFYGTSVGSYGMAFWAATNESNYRLLYTGSPTTYNNSTWRHFVFVRDNLNDTTNWRIYVNGVSVSTSLLSAGTLTTLDSTEVFRLAGSSIYNQSTRLNGALDDVLIFNKVLSEENARELYRSTANKTRP